jgi:hypothetical protein
LSVTFGGFERGYLVVDTAGVSMGREDIVTPSQARTQTLECTAAGEVLRITYEQVKQLYYQTPQFGFYFLQLSTKRLFENSAFLEGELSARRASRRNASAWGLT